MLVQPISSKLKSDQSENQEVRDFLESVVSAVAKQPFSYLSSFDGSSLSSRVWTLVVNNPHPKLGLTLLTASNSSYAPSRAERNDRKRENQREIDQRALDQQVEDFFNSLQENSSSTI